MCWELSPAHCCKPQKLFKKSIRESKSVIKLISVIWKKKLEVMDLIWPLFSWIHFNVFLMSTFLQFDSFFLVIWTKVCSFNRPNVICLTLYKIILKKKLWHTFLVEFPSQFGVLEKEEEKQPVPLVIIRLAFMSAFSSSTLRVFKLVFLRCMHLYIPFVSFLFPTNTQAHVISSF